MNSFIHETSKRIITNKVTVIRTFKTTNLNNNSYFFLFCIKNFYPNLIIIDFLKSKDKILGLQAIAKLQLCFQADPRDLDTLWLLAEAFTVIGDEAKAFEVHKEMARIAREVGNRELFEELLERLVAVAPDDEQVQALRSAPPPLQVPPTAVSEAEAESDLGFTVTELAPAG